MSTKQKKLLRRIIVALVLFVVIYFLPLSLWLQSPYDLYVEFALFLIPYFIAGYDVLLRAAKNIGHGQIFDENFLMSIATIGAFALVFFPDTDPHMAEGAAVMLFYQIGELFQSYAVGKSRKSIAKMMDIAPDHANVKREGQLLEVDPSEVAIGETIVCKPGERVPLDGIILTGSSQIDTSALTGESVPRVVEEGSEVLSGSINLSGLIEIQVNKQYEESTVARILELVEEASEKKARTENFITRFARFYTPIVVIVAVLLMVGPPLIAGLSWSSWVERGLVFLVVSCPCALVISVPLSFFGGIGGASKLGILVKGGNYFEVLAKADTVVFDKTGTLTDGTFEVVAIHAEEDLDPNYVLSIAAHAEAYSDHPIAISIREAYSGEINHEIIEEVSEKGGHGVSATIDKHVVIVGNDKLMRENNIEFNDCDLTGTILHISYDGRYIGHIVIADVIKKNAKEAIDDLRKVGIKRTYMLTGDRLEVAKAVASEIGIDEVHAQLLPQGKVDFIEELINKQNDSSRLAFVGDGINDAPVLTRSDVGIAMGAVGSDAAIEAADIVLVDDNPKRIAQAIHISKKTVKIVWQNIIFAIGVKVLIMILAGFGLANMWEAVFGDVGVTVIAIINAMRAMNVSKFARH